MHRRLLLDPTPAAKLDSLHALFPEIASVIEECLDWIAADPPDPRAKRRRFLGGLWAILRSGGRVDWLILWDEDGNEATVRFIGETTSL